MGRSSTGVYTTGECLRIEMSWLKKTGLLVHGEIRGRSLEWTNGSSINLIASLEKRKFIRLIYNSTVRGERTAFDYEIQISAIPSNLGKGEILYFICPKTGDRCRILYNGYGSGQWWSREAYLRRGCRIYYDCQQNSKLNRANDKYWKLERQLEKLEPQKYTKFYNGRPTKYHKKIMKMRELRDYYDWLRWTPEYMPQSIWGYMGV